LGCHILGPEIRSLTASVGGDDRVRETHREAVSVALSALEARYTQARLGGDTPAETTGQFIAAKFQHDTARPLMAMPLSSFILTS
jgi:conjugative relaxase-like TrwC/TraI family protein